MDDGLHAALVLALARQDPATLRECARVSTAWRRGALKAVAARRADISLGCESVPIPVVAAGECWAFPNAEYVAESVGADAETRERLRDAAAAGCDCRGGCAVSRCSCVSLSSADAYDTSGRLRWLAASPSAGRPECSLVIVECSAACGCSDACANRVVSRGVRARLEVFGTARYGERGWGVRARERIPRGTFVCEYAGELVSSEEATRRHRLREETAASNYIMSVREHVGGPSGRRVLTTHIDPSRRGNVGRYLNHSCQPNLETQVVRAGSLVPRLAFFACADIDRGDELTFDYGGGAEPSDDALGSDLSSVRTRRRCLCGAACCAGWLPNRSA